MELAVLNTLGKETGKKVVLSDVVFGVENPNDHAIYLDVKQYLANLCKGAVNQANINTKELQKIPICIPPLSLQQLFAKKIEAIEIEKKLIKQSIAETEELFNSRMDYYFN